MASGKSRSVSYGSRDNWQTEKRTIRERTAYMINNPLMSDVKFVIQDSQSASGNEFIYAHKLLLSLSSPVFHAMFYGDMVDTREEIPLSDCGDARSFLEFMRYLYSDELNLTSGNVFELLYLAKKYITPSLADKCCRFLEEVLRESNVFKVLEHARLFSETHLEQRCWQLLETKTSACLRTEGFLWISHDTLSSLLKRDSLTLVDGEFAVFTAAKRWATAQCRERGLEPTDEQMRKALRNIVHLIRFPMIPPRLFDESVVPTGILSDEEVSLIHLYYKEGSVPTNDMKFSCVPRGPRLPARGNGIELARCYRYRENHTIGSSETFLSVSDSLRFTTNKEMYFSGVRLYASGEEGKRYLVEVRLTKCQGLKEEVSGVRGSFTIEQGPGKLSSRLGLDVLIPKPLFISREVQYKVKVMIIGNDNARVKHNKGIPMNLVKCEGIEFKFEGQSKQILEILFYTVD